MTEVKKGEEVFDGVENQDVKRPANVKTISLGWGQEEMSPSQGEVQASPGSKSKGSYFFVKHP